VFPSEVSGKAIPLQDLGFPGFGGLEASRHAALESGKVVCHTYRPPLPEEIIFCTNFRYSLIRTQEYGGDRKITFVQISRHNGESK
jgi:hypothetical protein